MYLYAVTYTDPSEPWGVAVHENKLYRTPGELLTAFNDTYDKYVHDYTDDLRGNYTYFSENYVGVSFEEMIAQEFSREYGVGRYELEDS